MMKQLFFIIFALLASGHGAWAQDNPDIEGVNYNKERKYYEIPDAEALNALAKYVNEVNDCSGLKFVVTHDITFTESDTFAPIGSGDESEGHPFAGTFDGGNFTISGINYSDTDENCIGVALFGYIAYPAVIRNITLDNCSFTGNFEVGAIVGASSGSGDNADYGIFNCTVGSNVKVEAKGVKIDDEELPGVFVGGIIGSCQNMVVSNCTSAATVTGDDYVGGITGRLLSSKNEAGQERCVLENCYFTGTVNCSENKGDIAGAFGPVEDYDGTEGTKGLVKITLLDDDTEADINNKKRIQNYHDIVCDVTIEGRKLWKDGSWNTICLPFKLTKDMREQEDCPLHGATVMKMDYTNSGFSDGTLTLNFSDISSGNINSKTAYIVRWSPGSPIENPVFKNVTVVYSNTSITTDSDADFRGIYTPMSIGDDGDKTILYLGADNKLYYPEKAMKIKAFRAYFKLQNGITAGNTSSPASIRSFNISFGDEEGTTAISALLVPSPSGGLGRGLGWYTLDGRRLNGKPSQNGLYISSGKKVVVK